MFYKSFLITIIMLFMIYFAALYEVKNQIKIPDIKKEYNSFKAINFIKEINNILPQELSSLEKKYILNNAIKIKKEISISIEHAYNDVYSQIPKFVDKHYTVTGEYAELYSILVGDIGNNLKHVLYVETNFNDKIIRSITSVMELNMFNLNKKIDKINQKVINNLEVGYKPNIKPYQDVIDIIKQDTMKRYREDSLQVVRYGGTITTASILVMSKTIAKKLTLKIMAKSSTKVFLKYGTSGLTAVGGATVGSVIPGWGTAVGGVVGGVIGWFGTDKLIIEVDEYLNREEFEKELISLIVEQKKLFEQKIYIGIIETIKKDIDTKIYQYKNISIKDILKR